MKHKVSELEGALLDAAVAKAAGYPIDEDGDRLDIEGREAGGAPGKFRPSTDWNQGGPIIERERIALDPYPSDYTGHWRATKPRTNGWAMEYGPEPLIAAMRAYVASKFGEEVELP